jgi:hypothetical protein
LPSGWSWFLEHIVQQSSGKLRAWMQAFPPAGRDLEFQQQFAPLGLLDTDCPYRDPDAELTAALRDGLALGKKNLADALTHGASPEVNGWKLTYHSLTTTSTSLRSARSTTRPGSLKPQGPIRRARAVRTCRTVGQPRL